MCGIVGYLSNSREVNEQQFVAAVESLNHRGPDDKGVHYSEDKKIALGHTRLSFLDLTDRGRQPLSNKDNTVWITFNGEIYNYLQLKERLIKEGHEFQTTTDTEVIILGYEEWGIDVLQYLEGMFAFCLFDVTIKKAYLARDRFGIKPLYYSTHGNRLLFASETKALISSGFCEKRMDMSSFADFFAYRYIPSPKSIWKDISKLAPATFMEYDIASSDYSISEYWRPNFSNDFCNRKVLIEEIGRSTL